MDNKCSNINNTAFQSRIVFLSPRGFGKILSKKNKNLTNICNYDIIEDKKNWYNCYKTNVGKGYTSGVKTCTAGISVNKGKKASLFWHAENTLDNLKNFPILGDLIKGTNIILVGSKKGYKYSYEFFNQFINQAKGKNIPTTIFKGTKSSEADILYESKKDTLYICLKDIFKRDCYVSSMEDLKKACDIVEISPTDSIEFYDFLPKETMSQRLKNLYSRAFNL